MTRRPAYACRFFSNSFLVIAPGMIDTPTSASLRTSTTTKFGVGFAPPVWVAFASDFRCSVSIFESVAVSTISISGPPPKKPPNWARAGAEGIKAMTVITPDRTEDFANMIMKSFFHLKSENTPRRTDRDRANGSAGSKFDPKPASQLAFLEARCFVARIKLGELFIHNGSDLLFRPVAHQALALQLDRQQRRGVTVGQSHESRRIDFLIRQRSGPSGRLVIRVAQTNPGATDFQSTAFTDPVGNLIGFGLANGDGGRRALTAHDFHQTTRKLLEQGVFRGQHRSPLLVGGHFVLHDR